MVDINKEQSASLVFCMACGSPELQFKAFHKGGSVQMICQACGGGVLVSNAVVANTTLDPLLLKALERAALKPPKEDEISKAAKNRPTKDKGFCTIHTRMTIGQREVIKEALALYRKIVGASGRAWQGSALERICADFIAGNSVTKKNTKERQVPTYEVYKPDFLKTLKGADLENLAVFTFMKNLRSTFSDDDDMRQWIEKERPSEFSKPVKLRKAKVKKRKLKLNENDK